MPTIINTPYNNIVVKMAGVGLVVCCAAILLNQRHNPPAHKENERNKRYVIKSKSDITKSIDSHNRATGHIKHNYFSNRNRLKRFLKP